MSKYAILAEGSFHVLFSKTGNSLIRYRRDDVVGVIDSRYTGKTAADVIGMGPGIPVVASVLDLLKYQPDTLVIGNAPQGGRVSEPYRKQIMLAMQNGLNIISGMHEFISEQEDYRQVASANGVTITDLRKPPRPPHFPRKTWLQRKVPVLLTIGTDCDSGKMTTALEISRALEARGLKAPFIGTGQTGILLAGSGVPIDAVVSDFMAGEMEYAIDQVAEGADIILVEGQGAMTNMLYSGVSLGLLHGCMPDFLVLCHEPLRQKDVSDYPIPGIQYILDLHRTLMEPFKQVIYCGINLLTYSQTKDEAQSTIEEYAEKYHIPTTDLVRFGTGELIDTIIREVKKWN